jgi:fatty acid desaturase
MSARARLFRYSSWDAIPALCGLGSVALLVAICLFYAVLPGWALAAAFALVIFAYCWNVQSISHNFIHNAFFVNPWANRVFSVLESIAMGIPQTIYHHYHLNHHFGDNDRKGPDGTTRDWGSTFRHGKGDQPEGFWSFIFVGFFRFELDPCFRMIRRNGRSHVLLLLAESLALGLFWIALLVCNWRYFLLFYLPSYYLGWVLIYAHTYFLHWGAEPGNHYANSVSSYEPVYNALFFNNGYHQEHHWDPKAHWTKMREVREEIRPQMIANRTRVLRGPHLTIFLEDWWKARSRGRRVLRPSWGARGLLSALRIPEISWLRGRSTR